MKRPVAVYFEKAKDLLFALLSDPKSRGPVEIVLTGAGGAIPRCEQVARYLVQEVKIKWKSLLKSVGKKVSRGTVSATEFKSGSAVETFQDEEELALNLTVQNREIATISITITIVRN
jgi:hypothetical protein